MASASSASAELPASVATATLAASTPVSASTSATSSPAAIRIRYAHAQSASDVSSIVALGRSVFSATFGHQTTPENMAGYLDDAYSPSQIQQDIENPQRRVFVAESEGTGEIAGFAFVALDSTDPSVKDWPKPVEIQRIYVDTRHHGGGVARLLADQVMDWARQEGYQSIWLGVYPENARALRFYTKCGFEKVGEHPFYLGEKLEIDDIMVRRL